MPKLTKSIFEGISCGSFVLYFEILRVFCFAKCKMKPDATALIYYADLV